TPRPSLNERPGQQSDASPPEVWQPPGTEAQQHVPTTAAPVQARCPDFGCQACSCDWLLRKPTTPLVRPMHQGKAVCSCLSSWGSRLWDELSCIAGPPKNGSLVPSSL